MLFVIAVVNVALLLPGLRVPIAVPVTPAGKVAAQPKEVGLMVEETVITALLPEQIGPTVGGAEATGKG